MIEPFDVVHDKQKKWLQEMAYLKAKELEVEELREQNRVLREALQAAKYELAALFPIPSAPTVHAALEVCGNNNEADARCIYMAYEIVRASLTATSQPGCTHEL